MQEINVQIDPDNLDKECLKLPSQYLQAAHASAEAKRDVDEAKNALEVVEAELSASIRTTPSKYGLESVTEKSIAAKILLQKEYQRALRTLTGKRHEAELAQALVWALEHKKRSLTLLVDLHGMSYFSSPDPSPEGRRHLQERVKRSVRRAGRED